MVVKEKEAKDVEEEINASRINDVEDHQSVTERHLDRITKHLKDTRQDYEESEPIYWQGEPEVIEEEGSVFEHPFKVSLVPAEDPDDDYLLVSKGRLHFWNGDSWKIEEKEITEGEEETVSCDDEGVYDAEFIYAQLTYSDGWSPSWSWSLGHGTDNPQDPKSEEIPEDDQTQRTWIIAKLETDGSIDQRINQDIYETMGG